ncbi:MAG: 4Fe-4S binding protein [Peptococcia bacterium]
MIQLDIERCKGCELCTMACPVNILVLSQEQANSKGNAIIEVTEPEKCTSCARCAQICPDTAITVYRNK